jgi:hypothetical protein
MGYYLTQRLMSRSSELREGFDSNFGLEYMGSAEYEWDTPSRSLKAIRSAGRAVIVPHNVTYNGITRPVYFVAAKAGIADKIAEFQNWLDGGLRSKERTHFGEVFTNTARNWIYTDAWWSYSSDIMFALTAELAEKLAHGINTRPAAAA